MKILHVTGTSGTGKTRFIRELVPALKAIGPTGVVKHIGHHLFRLEPEKDTTLFFESGARMSAGLDPEKSVVVVREPELYPVLALFADNGIQYTIIEGFKQLPFNKIVFGTLPGAENVLMIEPSVDEVLSRLDDFSEISTPGEIAIDLRSVCPPGGSTLVCTFPAPPDAPTHAVAAVKRKIVPADGGAMITLRSGGLIRPEEYHLGVCAPDARAALKAAFMEIDRILPKKNQGDDA